jgi:hypothetical protein
VPKKRRHVRLFNANYKTSSLETLSGTSEEDRRAGKTQVAEAEGGAFGSESCLKAF